MKRLFIYLWLLFFIFFFASCGSSPPFNKTALKNSSIFKEGEVKDVLIKEEETNVYSGSNTNFPILTTINKGKILKVTGRTAGWYVILLPDGQVGCIEKNKVVPYIESVEVEDNIILEDDLCPEEKTLLNLVNDERQKSGLNPLKIDLKLSKLARLKSKDLIESKYFNHYSPTYGSPFEMMEKHKITYIFAGENLAGNKNVKDAHYALMESTTHRQNILNPTFTHIGIGMGKGGPYGKIFTQLFVGR